MPQTPGDHLQFIPEPLRVLLGETLRGLLGSKKFIAALTCAGVVSAAQSARFNPAACALIAAPFIAYILAQGLADFGKGAEGFDLAADYARQRAEYDKDSKASEE